MTYFERFRPPVIQRRATKPTPVRTKANLWPEADQAMVRKLAAQGLTGLAIANEMGRTRGGIIGWCKRNDVRLLGNPRRPEGLKESLEQLRKAGLTVREIAEKVGRTRQNVSDILYTRGAPWLKGAKLPKPPKAAKPKAKKADWPIAEQERVRSLAAAGQTATQISEATGRTRNSVTGWCHRNDVKLYADAVKKSPKVLSPQSYLSEGAILYDMAAARVSLIDRASHQCRWPLGDPKEPDFAYCAHTRFAGYSYCQHHQKRSVWAA